MARRRKRRCWTSGCLHDCGAAEPRVARAEVKLTPLGLRRSVASDWLGIHYVPARAPSSVAKWASKSFLVWSSTLAKQSQQ